MDLQLRGKRVLGTGSTDGIVYAAAEGRVTPLRSSALLDREGIRVRRQSRSRPGDGGKTRRALDGGPPCAHVVLAEMDGSDSGKIAPNPEAYERGARRALEIQFRLNYDPEARSDVTDRRA